MIWKITFFDGSYGYIEAVTLGQAVQRLGWQNWNQDITNVSKVEVVENGLGPEVVNGWYSKAA